jgi:predicted Rossmann fold nucleotide-binding protein DprA/Smf involved in DNA uptake
MARNKVIYGIADHTLVVSAELQKGGTWAGAEEELKRPNHRPVFVRVDGNEPSGNRRLLEMGAIAWPSEFDKESLSDTLAASIGNNANVASAKIQKQQILFDITNTTELDVVPHELPEQPLNSSITVAMENNRGSADCADEVYFAVLPVIKACADEPRTVAEYSRRMDVIASQVKKWLERAFAEGVLEKQQNPVRFSLKK